MDEFKAIADAMRALNLNRDRPFAEPLAPTWEQELAEKLLPTVVDDQPDDLGECFGYY